MFMSTPISPRQYQHCLHIKSHEAPRTRHHPEKAVSIDTEMGDSVDRLISLEWRVCEGKRGIWNWEGQEGDHREEGKSSRVK